MQSVTGNRALMLEEPLIFEIGSSDRTGVDFAEIPDRPTSLGGLERSNPIGLPGLSEPEAVRHYTRLSRQNYAIDLGLFPLGSCTMKHNPRLNEKVARQPGFADVHPLQPRETVQGALQVVSELASWLLDLTGMHSVAMSPKAGAHGELCGLLCIRAALEARGDKREVVLVPESAHGTNPATAAFAGYRVENIPANAAGRVDLDALKARLGPDVAAVMITNPNTCGLFEPDMKAISDAVHLAGAFVYCDGESFKLVEEENAGEEHPSAFGRMVAFHGQMGMFTRALAYILSHGADGLKQVAEDAVLNANYVLRSLEDVLDAPFAKSGPCMHEAIFSDKGFSGGISTFDLAKALIDEGFHPMTMYFPLVVHGAMLVEPTETESIASLDQFIAAVRSIAERAKEGDESLKAAPLHAPRRRLDETLAARKPVLVAREAGA